MVETVIERAERVGVKVSVPIGSKNKDNPVFHLLHEHWDGEVFTECGGYAVERTPPTGARWCRNCLRRLAATERRLVACDICGDLDQVARDNVGRGTLLRCATCRDQGRDLR